MGMPWSASPRGAAWLRSALLVAYGPDGELDDLVGWVVLPADLGAHREAFIVDRVDEESAAVR
jgi:hypothetical protein